MRSRSRRKGFTLVELLIAIAIIAILVSIVLAYLSGAKSKGRDAKRIADIKQIEQGLEIYFSNCNSYPLLLSSLLSDCTGSKILTAIPTDPLPSESYTYAVNDAPVEYHVCATLELGYAGGTGKSSHIPLGGAASGTSLDTCNGSDPLQKKFDRYGP